MDDPLKGSAYKKDVMMTDLTEKFILFLCCTGVPERPSDTFSYFNEVLGFFCEYSKSFFSFKQFKRLLK